MSIAKKTKPDFQILSKGSGNSSSFLGAWQPVNRKNMNFEKAYLIQKGL